MEQSINNIDIKKRFLLNLKNFKARLKLDSSLNEAWNNCISKLINLGETINNNLDLFSEEELMDLLKIFDTASVVHDITISPIDKEHQLNILENLISQGESQVSFILEVNGIEQNILNIGSEKNKEELENMLENIKDNIDYFGTRLIFVNRDSKDVGYLTTYFKAVGRLYQRLQTIHEAVIAEIKDSGLSQNKELIRNLERLVKVMYRTLGITDTKTMRINLGVAEDSINKFEESLNEKLNKGTSHNKL